jgi:hypothetical protein
LPLLDDVAAAAGRYRCTQRERERMLEELRAKLRVARDEGIPFT